MTQAQVQRDIDLVDAVEADRLREAAGTRAPKHAHPPIPASLGNGIWQTASWNDPDTVYQQDLKERTCTCPAGTKGRWCKHLTGALIASFTLQLTKARNADGVVVRALLARGTHRARPEIEMALLLADWHEQLERWDRMQAETPGEEPEPDGAPALTCSEYKQAVSLLSEGRKGAA